MIIVLHLMSQKYTKHLLNLITAPKKVMDVVYKASNVLFRRLLVVSTAVIADTTADGVSITLQSCVW